MSEERVAEVLAAHAEELLGRPGAMQEIHVTKVERERLAPLFRLAERIQQDMQPVQPSADFVRSLGKELVGGAKRQIALTKRLRRAALIGAAAIGSILSIASVIGAIVFVIARLRAQSQAQTAHAPTG